VLNQEGTEILLDALVETLNAVTGRAKVTLPAEDLLAVIAQPASYSLVRTQPGGLTEAVFVNAQAGARAPINILNSVLPQHIPSSECTIPTLELSNQAQYDGTGYQNWPGWAGNPTGSGSNYYFTGWNTEYFSSYIEPRGPITTIQMTLVGYTGTIKIQAAETYQSIWYNVSESRTYLNSYETIFFTIVGWHPLLRVGFNNNVYATPLVPGQPASAYAYCVDGFLTNIVVQNGGSGYLAPPKVSIIGNGAGAEAVATINSGGTVTGIEVTNQGSGYWPILAGGVNTAAYPIPPQNQGAIVVISTGAVADILYR
jgi:hypothetical protein